MFNFFFIWPSWIVFFSHVWLGMRLLFELFRLFSLERKLCCPVIPRNRKDMEIVLNELTLDWKMLQKQFNEEQLED